MEFQIINNFTSNILNHLCASQNGNVAITGIGFYMLMAAIKFRVQGRSYDQLSRIIEHDFHQLYDPHTWIHTRTAKKWNFLRFLANAIPDMRSTLYTSCYLNDHFKKISNVLFNVFAQNMNFSYASESYRRIHILIRRQIHGIKTKLLDEIVIRNDRLIFIHTLYFRSDWLTEFDPKLTKPEEFYDETGRVLRVPMMNQYYYVKLRLPKFKILVQNDFVEILKHFGITDIFDRNRSDFGRMTNETVFIGNLMHLLYLAVDEYSVYKNTNHEEGTG
ncbi:hypothetical protein RF11_15476 [Thelohanellus kitauei]|uniref:Serpin domain-containing protein n=1 Tax=Thelohanellus kitauei TaxID=669202 RepID=A0A0C2MF69_THEKT|nr:hypothetical protein RF11_15476 [Thelohanellus kitauei]